MEFSDADDSAQTEETENGRTKTIHKAAENGNLELLTKAVQRDASALEQRDTEGLTPLAIAVQAQQYSAMKWLVKLGADVNAQDGDGRTCLSLAAYQGWMDGVLYLLKHGSKHHICDKHGRTPLSASTHCRDISTMTTLLMNISEEEINMVDNERMTALQWAAFHERPAHIQLLLSRGADVRTQDIDGKTALHWASQNGSLLSCKLLLEYCHDLVNITDNTGKTPAHLAAAAGKSDIIQELRRYDNFDVDALDKDDRSPLHWAAALGQAECVKTLLTMNAEWDAADIDGGTPLQYARQLGHTGCQKYLQAISNIKLVSGPVSNFESSEGGKNKNSITSAFSYIKNIFKSKSECDSMPPTGASDNSESHALSEFNNNIGHETGDDYTGNARINHSLELSGSGGEFSHSEDEEHTDSDIMITKQLSLHCVPGERKSGESNSKNVSVIQSELAKIDNRIRVEESELFQPQVCSKNEPVKTTLSNRLTCADLPPPPSPKPGELGPIRGPIPPRVYSRQRTEYPSPTRTLTPDGYNSDTPDTPSSSRKSCEYLRCSSRQETLSPLLTPEKICRLKQNTLTRLSRSLKDEPEYSKPAPVMAEFVGNKNSNCVRNRDSEVAKHSRSLIMDDRRICQSPTPIHCPVRKHTIERKLLDKQINSLLT